MPREAEVSPLPDIDKAFKGCFEIPTRDVCQVLVLMRTAAFMLIALVSCVVFEMVPAVFGRVEGLRSPVFALLILVSPILLLLQTPRGFIRCPRDGKILWACGCGLQQTSSSATAIPAGGYKARRSGSGFSRSMWTGSDPGAFQAEVHRGAPPFSRGSLLLPPVSPCWRVPRRPNW